MLKLLLLTLLLFCGMAHAAEPARATKSSELRLHGPLEKVYELFTPKGELLWIPTWRYTAVYPPGGETTRDMVFYTDDGKTTWTMVEREPSHRSVYVLMNADVVARIEVDCRAEGANETWMKITYVWTALTEKGREHVEAHVGPEFEKKMANWKDWLDGYARKEGWMK